jgi:hypothetical protein
LLKCDSAWFRSDLLPICFLRENKSGRRGYQIPPVPRNLIHSTAGNYIPTNYCLVPENFDFERDISTANDAFKLTENIMKTVNKKSNKTETFCHLVEHFYGVNHEIFVDKLQLRGIFR